MGRITDYDVLTEFSNEDLLVLVDVSDPAESDKGTTKSIEAETFLDGVADGAVQQSAASAAAAAVSEANAAASEAASGSYVTQANQTIAAFNHTEVVIESVVANAVTLTVGALGFTNGNNNWDTIPALPSTAFNNLQAIYLDITDLNAIAWGVPRTATIVSATQILAFQNWYGRLFSPIPGLQSLLDEAWAVYNEVPDTTYTTYVVAASGGDYTTVTAALADITDATAINQYILLVEPGTYTENGVAGEGLVLKDYIHIRGAGRYRTYLKGPEATAGNENGYSTIDRCARCVVEGVGLICYRAKYCVHADSPAQDGFVLRDFSTIHYGGQDGHKYDIGIGMHPDETMTFEDGDLGGDGFFAHGVASARVADSPWQLNIRSVTGRELRLNGFLEYQENQIDIHGCNFEYLILQYSDTYYDANPGDDLYNRGYYSNGDRLSFTGSTIGRIEYVDAFTIDTILVNPLLIEGTNESAINKGSGAVGEGQAVQLLVNPAIPDSYPVDYWSRNNVEPYDGTGIFVGWAEVAMVVDAKGSFAVRQGRPMALADGTTAIVYGDALELNASGNLEKYSSGEIVAYALEALPSGISIIEVKAVRG